MDEVLNLIANVGFPIAVAVFLLVRIESKITCLTKAINELREAILVMPRELPAITYSQARVPGREGA
ncbi:MAG TPA: YvrJ family protein [Syntrophomonas wolfei]|uniref:YvrJ family protein n=1 Tax=Syntrophomonas wolfei TaxID=863 RepID=A0A354YSJ9_9FIRM|nr:YvrJ family protein [Syntrophomonas wolfei]